MDRESTAEKLYPQIPAEGLKTDEEAVAEAHRSKDEASVVVEAQPVVISAQQKEEIGRLWRELGGMRRERGKIAEVIRRLYKKESEEEVARRIATAEKSLDKRIIAKEERLKALHGKGAISVQDSDISIEEVVLTEQENIPPPLPDDVVAKKPVDKRGEEKITPAKPRSRILERSGRYETAVGIGSAGVGGVVSAMEPSGGVLRHYAGPRPGEVETGPERTNEEAVADLDRDIAKKETSAEKLLEKLLRSEQKIHLDNEENVATILADKTLLAALEIQKWNGSKNILAQVAAEISLKKSDELVALEQKKGWLKRLFKNPEEKRLAQEMRALDDLIKTLSPGSKSEPISPQATRLIDTMTKR